MDDSDLVRLTLVDALISAGMRYEVLASLIGKTGLGALLSALATARTENAGLVLNEITDEEIRLAWETEREPGDLEVVIQAAEVAAADGAASVVLCALEGERDIAELLEDVPAGVLSDRAGATLEEAGRAATRQLMSASLTQAPADVSEFRSLRSGGGNRAQGPQRRIYEVWYGTNRQPIIDGGAITGFSGARDERIHVGKCGVAIPRSHKIGADGSRWWHRIIAGDDRLQLAELEPLETESFWVSVQNAVAAIDAKAGDAIIFLHGYNVSFEEAAIRAAQIGADLALPAIMAFFSWPSRGRVLHYTADEASIEASEIQISEFLTDFTKRSGASRVHLIAHSMGNRGLLRALDRITRLVEMQTAKPFEQIVLAAPDVDTDLFRSLCTAYGSLARRTTLYLSNRDLAVRLSEKVHAATRVGFAPPVAILPGIDTVNVTHADVTLIGHGYVASSRSVLTDIYQLLSSGAAPDTRAMLRELRDPKGRSYWEIAA